MEKQTQCQKVRTLLADKKWHSNIEIFNKCNCWRVGARIYDLKKKGCVIEAKNGKGSFYYYRLQQIA